MTLAAAFKALNGELKIFREELAGLQLTIREDKPLANDTVFVDTFGDATDDLLGWLQDSLAAAREGERAAQHPIDLGRVWQALIRCQEQINRLTYRYVDLIGYEQMAPLLRFGRQRGGEWRAWAGSVKSGLDRCRRPLYETNQALFRCWQEIAERAGLPSMSVQTSNIGQQISFAAEGETAQELI